MKKVQICAAVLVVTSFFSVPLHAQFFKKIANSVKQSMQSKANSKADSAAASKINSGGTNGDTASTNRVLNAFAKAAADNPNDTSASSLTMKALGNLTGGGGVSRADSIAAI